MNNAIKYSFTVLLLALAAISCRDEDAVRFPNLQEGVNARVVLYPERSFLNFANLAGASIAFDVYSASDIEEIVYSGTYVDASLPQKVYAPVALITVPGSAFVEGKATEIKITSAELATKFNLPGGIAFLDGGDNFTFTATAKLKDGRVFDGNNSAPSITQGNNASFTQNFKVFVACPFVVADAVGTYTITRDDFATWLDDQVEIVAGPGPGQVTLKDLFGHPEVYDIVVNVDPAKGDATIARQQAWHCANFGCAFGVGSIESTVPGLFFSCTGFLTITVKHTVAAGSFGDFRLELTKN
jgi:hypothetical protein